MSVKLRLKRIGRKKSPYYRIVVIEDSNSRNGEEVEIIGTYDPMVKPSNVEVKEDRVKHWISVGAQPSDTVSRLLSQLNLVEHKPKASSNQKVARKDRASKKEDSE